MKKTSVFDIVPKHCSFCIYLNFIDLEIATLMNSGIIFVVLTLKILCVQCDEFDLNFDKGGLTYNGEKWDTPLTLGVRPIKNATIMPNGLVFNATKKYTFDKWYFNHPHYSTVLNLLLSQIKISDPNYHYNKGYFFSFIQIWQHYFQHIAFDTFPRIRLLCDTVQKNTFIGLLVMSTLQKDLMIEACPIEESRFQVITKEFSASTIAPVVWLPDSYAMGIVPPNSFKSLGPQDVSGTKIIYLPRFSNARTVVNEAQVIKMLQHYFSDDLLIYKPINQWKKDRNVFKDAKIIIGPHGGAMANMIFAPVNTTIIEFLSLTTLKKQNKNERPCYFGLAKGMGFNYVAIEPERFVFEGSMTIPLELLNSTLKMF